MIGTGAGAEEPRVHQEESVVRRYALRWSVLAAWRDALSGRRTPVPEEVERGLTSARIKLASGCFSACEIGCDLAPIEASLTRADASSAEASVDFWLGLLGHSMTDEAERILKVPAVKFRFADCGVPGCRCETPAH